MKYHKGYFRKGFTLIELLVVIAIIGILASVILAALSSARKKGNDAKIISQLKSMAAQAQLFNGAGQAVAWSTYPVDAHPGFPSTGLFWDTSATSNSLYVLALTLPASPFIVYSSDGNSPLTGGKWAFAAATSNGSYCIDYTGTGITKTTQVLTAGNKFNATQYFNLPAPTYSCN